jgi:AraC-like DNA-binding protein
MIKPIPESLPLFFIAPILNRANLMRIDKANDSLVITCNPTVLSRILNIDMSPNPHLFIVLPSETFYPLWQELLRLSSTEQRIKCFSDFVEVIHQGPYCQDEIDIVFNRIVELAVSTPLYEIIKSCPVSERSLQRKFLKRAGISPKMLARIVRINYLWGKIKNNQPIDYQDLVYEGNYFDQTHFIKDFKAITGETPDYFFKRDLDVVKIMSGKR